MKTNPFSVKKLALCGVLTAFAIALSIFERLFPLGLLVPVPGVKLGLANVVTLFALVHFGKKEAFSILIARILLVTLLIGSVTSFLFSLLGGVFSLLLMSLLLHKKDAWFTLYGISIAGAGAHNIGQILAAAFMLSSIHVVAYLPLLLIMAVPTGLLTGYMATLVLNALEKHFFP